MLMPEKTTGFSQMPLTAGVTCSCRPINRCCLLAVDRGHVYPSSRQSCSLSCTSLRATVPPGAAGDRRCAWDGVPPGCNQPLQLAGATHAPRGRAGGLFGVSFTTRRSATAAPASHHSHLPKDTMNGRSPLASQVLQIPTLLLCSWDTRLLASERIVGTNGK